MDSSRWIHKDINQFNRLVFPSEEITLLDNEYKEPYLAGFQHSREDEQNAIPTSTTLQKSINIRGTLRPYARSNPDFDVFCSSGLLLLEINVWECFNNIYTTNRQSWVRTTTKTRDLPLDYREIYRICQIQRWEREEAMRHTRVSDVYARDLSSCPLLPFRK